MLRFSGLVCAVIMAMTLELLVAMPAKMEMEAYETKIVEQCAKEYSVNTTEIFQPKYDPTLEPNFPCFFKCCFMTLNYVDEMGNTNMTKYKEKFEVNAEQEKKEKECSTFTDDDLCIKVLVIQTCFLSNLNLE